MAYWKNYHTPRTVPEALELLARYQGEARVMGGGTDLLLEIQQGHRPKIESVVDPSRIEGLNLIEQEGSYLVIGAAVTHTDIVGNEGVQQQGTCLVESCGVIGGPQVRNVGTLAGNVAHALPAGDGTIGLLALGGEVEVASTADEKAPHTGTAWVPLQSTFLGPGKSTIDPTTMMITRLRFPATGTGEGSAFRRIMRPQGVALPMISMAARIHLDGDSISEVRIAIGPAGTTPFLAQQAMTTLSGQPADASSWHAAAAAVLEEANFRSSKHRSTAAYREEMVRTQVIKVLDKAAERAKAGFATPEGVGS